MIAEIVRTYRLEAAHRLPRVPASHKCSRMHGHGYEVEVRVRGLVGAESGWVMDYAEVDAVAEPVVASLDHRCLNEVEGLANPTSEHLARWIFERLRSALPALVEVAVSENPNARCVYRGEEQ